jgi:HAMP domain-containing protein
MVPGNGDLFSAALAALIGVWLLYVWPRSVRRQIERGDLSEEDAQVRLRMCPPSTGYAAFLMAICFTCVWLFNNGFFSGREIIVGVLMLGFSLGLIAFSVWRMRKAKR